MSSMTESDSSRRKYSRISIGRRTKLVQLIKEEHYTIAKASKRLGIKASTARMIYNKFKETGDFPMKNFRKSAKPALKKAKCPRNQKLILDEEEENVSPLTRTKEHQEQQPRQDSAENTGEVGVNWVYFWVYLDYTSYPYNIL